ncbi:hypothetical protein PFMG_03161 [Plasmodium falciparum IGH-CR14]|uniref:G domain-containing protein n=1 Tax=Plasmodium falciparum IGH-CR14 TaxID=580059 RepID=A0A0L1ID11_PLAFA|nr:hypothetical protein PFMG_03161 [Plasmodium falciparum IGH-CR14]
MYITKDKNDENKRMDLDSYKNIIHNKKRGTGLLNNKELLDKGDIKKGADIKEREGCLRKSYDIKNDVEEDVSVEDEDDSDYDVSFDEMLEKKNDDENYENEEEEEDDDDDDDDDVLYEDEYDEEIRDINFNSYNNYYYRVFNNNEDGKNEIEELIKNNKFLNNKPSSHHEDDLKKKEVMFEKYNKLLSSYKLKKEYNNKKENIGWEKEVVHSYHNNETKEIKLNNKKEEINNMSNVNEESPCYSCKSEDINYDDINNDKDFINDVLDRIDEIYNKECRYKNLKCVNNKNNKICINDLNLSIISEYLNVDISVFHKKTTVLLVGNTYSGKSSFINWIAENYVQNTNSINKKNEITYVDIKNNFTFNFKKLNNKYNPFGILNEMKNKNRAPNIYSGNYNDDQYVCNNNNKYNNNNVDCINNKITFSGEHCDYLFRPFRKLRENLKNVKKYIYGKISYQNDVTKYMNRINYVSFIDSTGINEMKDEEYDNILMNLTKYVDLVFIFIDSTKLSINKRLLRIINYIIDNQMNKVTICLTKIDMIKKINLYRLVFYLTQYFLGNLNIFKYNLLNDNKENNEDNDNTPHWNDHHNYMINDYKKRDPHFLYGDDFNDKPIYKKINNFLNRSMRSFQNIFLMPEVLKRMINTKHVNRKVKRNLPLGDAKGVGGMIVGDLDEHHMYNEQSILPANEDGVSKNNQNEEQEESLFKKILTKSYSSFKGKLMQNNLSDVDEEDLGYDKRISKNFILEETGSDQEYIHTLDNVNNDLYDDRRSFYTSPQRNRYSNKNLRNEEHYKVDVKNKYNIKNMVNNMENTNYKKREDNTNYNCKDDDNKDIFNKKKTNKMCNNKKIKYVDCIKNVSVFLGVLIFEVITTVYSLIHTSINTYLKTSGKKIINERKLQNLEDMKKEKWKYENNNNNKDKNKDKNKNCLKILDFLTIYLPEISNSPLKREKWTYNKDDLNYEHMKRNRLSCNLHFENVKYKKDINNVNNYDNNNYHNDYNNDDDIFRRSNKNDCNLQRRSIPVDFMLLDKRNEKNEIKEKYVEKKNYISNRDGYVYKEHTSHYDNKFYDSNKNNIKNIRHNNINMNQYEENIEKDKYKYKYKYNYNNDMSSKNGVKNMPNFYYHDNFNNEKRNNEYFIKENNYYYDDDDDDDNIYKREMNNFHNNNVKELNMIHELLYKIDESINLKTNQSIYMLKKDLETIQNSCLKKIYENNEIIKKNKSLRIEKLKFYFFKYTAIFIGFIISLLRYDLLVYFSFIKPEILFSIFSKYFLFLSSYNKNSLFITINVILIIAYFSLYIRYNKRNYFKSLDKSDLNKIKIILLFTQIIFDEINQIHMKLLGKKGKK